MNILVIGGNGFIGSHLVDRLLELRHNVRIFDRLPEQHRKPLDNVEYRIGLLNDSFAIAEALAGIDLVYHLASTSLPSTSNHNPIADVQGNLMSTLVLLDQMVNVGVQRIVYISSGGTVYGNPLALPVVEDHPLKPICSYGIVKVAIENYLYMYQQLYGLKPIILRPANLYGPRQSHAGVQGIIATFLAGIQKGESLHVWGDGTVIRDYLFVTDLVELCIISGCSDFCGVYNAGYGSGHSIRQILDLVADITGISPTVIYNAARLFDVREVVLDIRKSKEVFGWSPQINLEDGIRLQWLWLNGAKQ